MTKKIEKFGGNESGDEKATILDTTKKPYRQLIHQNSITEFDFRQYLFARQSKVSFFECSFRSLLQLLCAQSRPIRVAKAAIAHIQRLSKDLEKNKQSLPLYFHQCWVYSASIAVVKICEGLQNPKSPQELQFLLGDLYYNARRKVSYSEIKVIFTLLSWMNWVRCLVYWIKKIPFYILATVLATARIHLLLRPH